MRFSCNYSPSFHLPPYVIPFLSFLPIHNIAQIAAKIWESFNINARIYHNRIVCALTQTFFEFK